MCRDTKWHPGPIEERKILKECWECCTCRKTGGEVRQFFCGLFPEVEFWSSSIFTLFFPPKTFLSLYYLRRVGWPKHFNFYIHPVVTKFFWFCTLNFSLIHIFFSSSVYHYLLPGKPQQPLNLSYQIHPSLSQTHSPTRSVNRCYMYLHFKNQETKLDLSLCM